MLHIDSDKFQEIATSPTPWQILIQPSAKGILSDTPDVNVFNTGDGEAALQAWIHAKFDALQNELGDSIKLTVTEVCGVKMEMHLTLSQLAKFLECTTLEERELRRIALLQQALDSLRPLE